MIIGDTSYDKGAKEGVNIIQDWVRGEKRTAVDELVEQ